MYLSLVKLEKFGPHPVEKHEGFGRERKGKLPPHRMKNALTGVTGQEKNKLVFLLTQSSNVQKMC